MVEIGIIQEWVAKADEDFEFALVNLKEGKPFVALILIDGLFRHSYWLSLRIDSTPNTQNLSSFLRSLTSLSSAAFGVGGWLFALFPLSFLRK
jgi:hypothetical protein